MPSIHDSTSMQFGLSTTIHPLDFQCKQKMPCLDPVGHSLFLTSNISRECPTHKPTSTNLDSVIIGVQHVTCWEVALVEEIVSVASSRLLEVVIFFERNNGNVFYDKCFAVIMQKSYRVQIAWRSSRVWTALHISVCDYKEELCYNLVE